MSLGRAWWKDPDDGNCSCEVEIITIRTDVCGVKHVGVATADKEAIAFEVHPIELHPNPCALTPLEAQVLKRLENGEPHRLPPGRVRAVFASLTRKGYGEEVEDA